MLDVLENQLFFRRMLGLEEHTSFECIGEVPESQLAFELCRLKRMTGAEIKTYHHECDRLGLEALDRYLTVDRVNFTVPARLGAKIFPVPNSESS